jgi:SAM-dependent methyltransferase
MREVWAGGDAYEAYIGRWSRRVAVRFLDWLDIGPGRRWLDVGCGTGALTAAIVAGCDPAEVVGVDPSAEHIAWATANVAGARFVVGDADHLPSAKVDLVVSGLALNFMPDAGAAVAAMRDRGETVAAYVWDYAGGMELIRRFWDAAVALDPAAAELDEATRFPMCRPDRLAAIWSNARLLDVTIEAIEVPVDFADFDDYWSPFLGGQGPAPGYVAGLDDRRRDRLRDRLQATLPTAGDRSIRLTARAWAVRGRSS